MPSIVQQQECDELDRSDPDEFAFDLDWLFNVTSPEGTEEVCSPDEACDLICDLVAEQFWDWLTNPGRRRRFKPRVKIYEVW